MGKLLYITANSKPENLSSSKTVGRALVSRFLAKYPDFSLEELDLYTEHLPRPKYNYFGGRSTLVKAPAVNNLPAEDQAEIRQMIKLCDQFISADIYILAAPMWSLSFPAPLKEYIDCIIQAEKTITFTDKKPRGLLSDRPRTFIYVQSSGADIPWIIKPALDKGLNYVEVIMKFIGIGKFEELLVDGTGTTEEERTKAIENAAKKIDGIIDGIQI
jgi:FMN-dependent NADH-azoreductase